jgi:hypothetical protein
MARCVQLGCEIGWSSFVAASHILGSRQSIAQLLYQRKETFAFRNQFDVRFA